MTESKNYSITGRQDKMVINSKCYKWISGNELVCGNQHGEAVLKSLYGSDFVTTNYNILFYRLNS